MISKSSFKLIYILFFLSALVLRYKIRKRTLSSSKIKGKIIARWTTIYIFYLYLIIYFGSFVEFWLINRNINLYLSFVGLILYVIGIAGREWAYNSLGEYWSVNIEIRKNHPIIKKGPYKYIRHPNNVFHSLEIIGFTLFPNSYYSLLVFFIFYLPVLIIRSIIEERAMSESLGESYNKYRKEVRAFFYFPIFRKRR